MRQVPLKSLTPIIIPAVLQHILYGAYGSVTADGLVGRAMVLVMTLGYGATASAAHQLEMHHTQHHTLSKAEECLCFPKQVQELTATAPYMTETTTIIITF